MRKINKIWRHANVLIYCALLLAILQLWTSSPQTQDILKSSQEIDFTSRELATLLKKPRKFPLPVDCQKLIAGSQSEITLAREFMDIFTRRAIPDGNYQHLTENCDSFKKDRGYVTEPGPTEEEKQFPIAYSILMYHNVEQVERLLRSIYRPQNFYCFHVDKNSEKAVLSGMKAVANCFSNVAIASKLETIVYTGYSRLQADLNCMEDALKHNSSWKYLINLSGEMFPLKTNGEIVNILKIYNGSNDVEGIHPGGHSWRWEHSFQTEGQQLKKTNKTKGPPPHGIQMVKGSAYGVFTRRFLEYALHDPWIKDFLEWAKDTYSPDEFVFSTLHNSGNNKQLNVPGSYSGDYTKNKWMAAYAHWFEGSNPCTGHNVRGICIPNVKDLPKLVKRKELFLNKLLPFKYDYLVMDCLEEWLHRKLMTDEPFDVSEYYKLPFVEQKMRQ